MNSLFDRNSMYTIRGVSMLLIMLHHIYKVSVLKYDADYGYPHFLMSIDIPMVSVFFFYSGFGMFHSLADTNKMTGSYIRSKFQNLVMPFLLFYILNFLVLFLHRDMSPTMWQILYPFVGMTPEGAALWFYDVILVIYVISFGTFYFTKNRLMTSVFVSVSVIVYAIIGSNFLEPYLYLSCLFFPLGLLMGYYKDNIERMNAPITILLSAFAYLAFNHYYVPNFYITFIFCKSFALNVLMIELMRYVPVTFVKKALGGAIYVGRESLLFYLFHIALLFFIPSFIKEHMYIYPLWILGLVVAMVVIYKKGISIYTKFHELSYKIS